MYIVNNYHMMELNRFITSRIGKSTERSRFYRDLSVDLRSERYKSVYFRSCGCYLLYNAIITRKKKKKKTQLSARKAAVRHFILSTAAAIIMHAKSYDLSSVSILSVVRYFLLLNQVRVGDILVVTVIRL